MGGVASFVQAILCRRFCKRSVFVVDVEFIFIADAFLITGITNINIQPTIGVEIGKHDAGAPFVSVQDTGFFRHVFKLPVAFVQIKFVGPHVGCEEYIRKAVVIDVANGHAAAVIEIPVAEDVEISCVMNGVSEINSGSLHQLKQRWRVR